MTNTKSFATLVEQCGAGTKSTTTIEIPYISQGVRSILPVLVAKGGKPGKRLLMMATQHGRELHGAVALGRAFAKLNPQELSGECVFLPVLNPLAVRMRAQDYPNELNRFRPSQKSCWNMNRTWGRDIDTWCGTVTKFIGEEFVAQVDAVVDLHGWSGLSTAWSINRDFLLAFGCPTNYVRNSSQKAIEGMLDPYADSLGVRNIVVELAPQNQLDLSTLNMAEDGIFNIMKHMGMLEGELVLPKKQRVFNVDAEDIITIDQEGLCEPLVSMGDIVESGQLVARLWDPSTMTKPLELRAPNNGFVFNICNCPNDEDLPASCMVYPGDTVALIKPKYETITN